MELNFATISVLIGIIGGILGILNQLSNMRRQQEEQVKAQVRRDTQLDDKLKAIESKLDEHNGYSKLYAEHSKALQDIANTIVAMQTDIKWIKESK